MKYVFVSDFKGQSIYALGIGQERNIEKVLIRLNAFFGPEQKIECSSLKLSVSNNILKSCGTYLFPGWLVLHFDANQNLYSIRFDGYNWAV